MTQTIHHVNRGELKVQELAIRSHSLWKYIELLGVDKRSIAIQICHYADLALFMKMVRAYAAILLQSKFIIPCAFLVTKHRPLAFISHLVRIYPKFERFLATETAETGHLLALKWFLKYTRHRYTECDRTLYYYAAQNNHLHVLRWLYNRYTYSGRCPINKNICVNNTIHPRILAWFNNVT